MITSTSFYGLKMQWTPEHTQWAEQHFDISSTTRSPAHKVEAYRGHLQRTYQYAWANDDISALTASNLLKKYAEKYSGILEGPNERALLCSYSEVTGGLLNGRKSENEPWQEGIYPMNCAPDVISVSKAGMTAALPPTDASASIGSSPGVASSLSEPNYSSSNCGSHAATTLHSSLSSQEYSAGYNGSYLHSSYSGQTTPALPSPHPSPLHSAGLLQPPPPPPPPPALVPSYNGASPNLPGYNYPPTGYPSQTSVGPGYSPGEAPPPSAYLPSGIAAPTPIPPSNLPSYTYQSHNHAPIAPAPLNGNGSNSLKRKAFYMSGHGEVDSSYADFNYNQQRSSQSPMYRLADSSVPDSNRGNGFDRNAEASSLAFKTTKASDQQRKFSIHSSGALTPPSFGSSKNSVDDLRAGETYGKFGSPILSEQSEEHRQHLPHSLTGPDVGTPTSSILAAEEQLKNSDPNLVDMVTAEILQQCPPVDWSDIAGLDLAKAAIKEEILWPILRPDMFSGLHALPRNLLLFGPQGTGRTLMARCMASQLGAAFLRLSSSALVTKWLVEGDKIIQASFLVARCRQPAVVFISEVDLLLSAQLSEDSPVSRLKAELLMQLDGVLSSAEDHVLVVCSTSKPEEIPESLRRYFTKRLLIPLPDGTARHQIINQVLSPHNYCLSDKEMSLLVQRTEGFSGLDVVQLCQEAAVGALHGIPGSDLSSIHPRQMRPVSFQDFDNVFCKFQPSISQKELDTYNEWNKTFGCSQ
ncbi:fidgetin [Syngnathus scovelli]|uniref:fidgetin n=1 Tax=Syngnathus scovelli TaxID=161590 RepID=UPI00210FEF25|nr:fidgetin [Syngnathus scovelli]XP_049583818.1 fidgetin [Syngnathus scovelli]XP_049583819.1 fidgetin [Syngnathus scovelli]XP_049583820.1 fidgetin [Syngnathus scovelli]